MALWMPTSNRACPRGECKKALRQVRTATFSNLTILKKNEGHLSGALACPPATALAPEAMASRVQDQPVRSAASTDKLIDTDAAPGPLARPAGGPAFWQNSP